MPLAVTSCSWESFNLGQGKKIANGPCCSSAISIQTSLSKRWPDPAQLQAQFVTRGPPCPSPSVAAGEQEGAQGQHSSHYLPHLLLIWASSLTTTNPVEDKQGRKSKPKVQAEEWGAQPAGVPLPLKPQYRQDSPEWTHGWRHSHMLSRRMTASLKPEPIR